AHLLAVPTQLFEARVRRLDEILEPTRDELLERGARDAEAVARVRERYLHRRPRRRVEPLAEPLEPPALLVDRHPAVGDVVDFARERVDRRDRAPLRAWQEHDPVREVLRARASDTLNLCIRFVDAHLTSTSAASRARRARDGFGRRVKTSQPA